MAELEIPIRKTEEAPDKEPEIPDVLPILPVENMVVYPFMIAPIIVADEKSKELIEDALRLNRMVGIVTRREKLDRERKQPFDDIYEVGTVSVILKMLKIPDGTLRLLLHGVRRMRIEEPVMREPYLSAHIEQLAEEELHSRDVEAMAASIQPQIRQIVQLTNLPEDLAVAAMNLNDPSKLADLVASNLNIPVAEQQEILETTNVRKRLERIVEIINRELQMLKLGHEIQENVKERIDTNQREYYLREQLKAIRRELGEDEAENADLAELRERLNKKALPEHARNTADKELRRLNLIHPSSAEYTVSRTYLEWLLELPWEESTRDAINIPRAKKILDEDHFGLENIKDRILEHLAVIKLKKKIRGPILCFVGPPGVGKTSLGRSIARALNRKFYRIALGGMRDEAEIRGHRRTYIGAMPGRIIKGIKECGSNNPVILLDEVDKIGSDFRGDPSSALLEVLDPQQNSTFTDNYLDMQFDLSRTMFLTTSNLLDTIPGALRDRMEVIQLSGYTPNEKIQIAQKFLIPRQRENAGLTARQLTFTHQALEALIERYTREAGLRNLEREIGAICRKVARKRAEGGRRTAQITADKLEAFLGPPRFFAEVADRSGVPGIVTGLAWTQAGGEILFVEASASKGTGKLTLTGQLGEVMKESAMAAISYLKSSRQHQKSYYQFLKAHDLHIHVPAGATPKDGPSAGITMCTAVASLCSNQPVNGSLAMTGEITLQGKVLPVGGIKEKVLAAHRAGVRRVILPGQNEKDLREIPEEVRSQLDFQLVNRIQEVLDRALSTSAPAEQKKPPVVRRSAAPKKSAQAASRTPGPKSPRKRVSKPAQHRK